MDAESLVVIGTFNNPEKAEAAHGELQKTGIYCLLLTDDTGPNDGPLSQKTFSLAVHRRDADIADAVLKPAAEPNMTTESRPK